MSRGRKPVEHVITELPAVEVSFDLQAFDDRIRSQGVQLVHYKAIRCPVGMTDLDDHRRPHEDHANCSKGFIYMEAGAITALMTGNGNHQDLREVGFVDGASVISTFPRFYDKCASEKPFYMATFDRFYLNDPAIVVPTWQVVKAHASGVDRLNFPAASVEYLVDARGDHYHAGDDFCLDNGQVKWLPTGRRPAPNLETDMGGIYSIRYFYRPWWVVGRLMHEIRVTQIDDAITGERKIHRAPQQAVLNREFLYLDSSTEERPGSNPRQLSPPEDGGFGPR